MPRTEVTEQPRQRILRAASDLFYTQGYSSTGVNQIIREADVAKATFYAYFPSKDDLGTAWLEMRSRAWLNRMRAVLRGAKTPAEGIEALFDALEAWLAETDYRGCPFLNTLGEVPDKAALLRDPIHAHLRELRNVFQALPGLDSEAGEQCLVIFYGAMALAPALRDPKPVHLAREACLKLLA